MAHGVIALLGIILTLVIHLGVTKVLAIALGVIALLGVIILGERVLGVTMVITSQFLQRQKLVQNRSSKQIV
jgi:hypothetical protein